MSNHAPFRRPPRTLAVAAFAGLTLAGLALAAAHLSRRTSGFGTSLGMLVAGICGLACLLALVHLLRDRARLAEALRRQQCDLAQARAELERSHERYRLFFEHNLDAVVVLEQDGAIVEANTAAREMLGLQLPLAGQNAHDLIDPSDQRLPALLKARARHGRARGELRVRRGDGRILDAEVSTVAYADASGRRLFGWGARDLTERHRARDQILQLNATLEQRVRRRTAEFEALYRELESFSYTVAHDLRAPLAAIHGFGEALAALLEDRIEERERHYLQRIQASACKMGDMIDALLELGRLSRSQLAPEAVDLGALAAAVVEDLRSAEPARAVVTRVQAPLPVQGDLRLLRIALENLVGNAWKFTGRRADALIEVGQCGQRDGLPLYFVRDNGAGFDMANAGRLFGAFQRLHGQDDFAGHGVGLATVSRIVRLHGGEIWADARPGVGATFYFTLGRVAPAAELAPAPATMAG